MKKSLRIVSMAAIVLLLLSFCVFAFPEVMNYDDSLGFSALFTGPNVGIVTALLWLVYSIKHRKTEMKILVTSVFYIAIYIFLTLNLFLEFISLEVLMFYIPVLFGLVFNIMILILSNKKNVPVHEFN